MWFNPAVVFCLMRSDECGRPSSAGSTENQQKLDQLLRQKQKMRRPRTEIDTLKPEDRCVPHHLCYHDNDRFIRLSVRLIPFSSSAAHLGNFEVVLSSSSRVFRLIRMIQDRVGIQTSRLEVFRSRESTEEACLPPESSLEECGFKGGPKDTPPEDTVYYDYRLLLTHCPILNCDHYFRSTTDSAAMRGSHHP